MPPRVTSCEITRSAGFPAAEASLISRLRLSANVDALFTNDTSAPFDGSRSIKLIVAVAAEVTPSKVIEVVLVPTASEKVERLSRSALSRLKAPTDGLPNTKDLVKDGRNDICPVPLLTGPSRRMSAASTVIVLSVIPIAASGSVNLKSPVPFPSLSASIVSVAVENILDAALLRVTPVSLVIATAPLAVADPSVDARSIEPADEIKVSVPEPSPREPVDAIVLMTRLLTVMLFVAVSRTSLFERALTSSVTVSVPPVI